VRRAAAAFVTFACALGAIGLSSAACGGGTRDIVPETHDVVTANGGRGGGPYQYVARRPLGFVALAREAGLGTEAGAATAEHLADAMDACATNLAAKGKLVDGAIRIEATIARDGSVAVSHVTVAPGDAVAANAILCVMAPLKMTTFSAAREDAGARSFAIDATWGPGQVAGSAAPSKR